MPETGRAGFDYLIIVGLIACLAWMTRIYETRIEPIIGTNTARRLLWMGALTLILVILYLAGEHPYTTIYEGATILEKVVHEFKTFFLP